MQMSFTRVQTPFTARPVAVVPRQRCVKAQATTSKDFAEVCKRTAAAVGAAAMMMSPFVGPAMARPSDFIQSKPGMSSGDATNEDKFPFNPSVSGNKAGVDTKDQPSGPGTPQKFSNNKGLGDKNVTNDAPLPSPVDTAPNPDKTGRDAFFGT